MSSTDDYEQLAAALFDEVLEPASRTKNDAGCDPYYPNAPNPSAETYFDVPTPVRRMTPGDFVFPGSGTASELVQALGLYWTAEGEFSLAAACPRLEAIAAAIAKSNSKQSAEVDIFCYTLF
jgi:hypothetical protein